MEWSPQRRANLWGIRPSARHLAGIQEFKSWVSIERKIFK